MIPFLAFHSNNIIGRFLSMVNPMCKASRWFLSWQPVMIVFFSLSSRHHHFHIPYYSHRIVLIISHFLFSPKQLASTESFHPISRCCRNPSCHSSQPWNINHQIKLEMVRLAESENEPSQFCSPEQKNSFRKLIGLNGQQYGSE